MSLNPWESQDVLMSISDQTLPEYPELNNSSVLYAALVLEETSELLDGMQKVLNRVIQETANSNTELKSIIECVLVAEESCKSNSVRIRNYIAAMETPLVVTLTDTEAVELADASTDIAVVNSGFMLASGMDGAKCYDEVAISNMSKANPVTGKIEKDPSGKWIKGSKYFKPNLHKVIFGE